MLLNVNADPQRHQEPRRLRPAGALGATSERVVIVSYGIPVVLVMKSGCLRIVCANARIVCSVSFSHRSAVTNSRFKACRLQELRKLLEVGYLVVRPDLLMGRLPMRVIPAGLDPEPYSPLDIRG